MEPPKIYAYPATLPRDPVVDQLEPAPADARAVLDHGHFHVVMAALWRHGIDHDHKIRHHPVHDQFRRSSDEDDEDDEGGGYDNLFTQRLPRIG
ncbi:hypothetical protein HDA40_006921 [Hamadaea flava]|uniref:Uncharacterized protein n=1 Tax=Hamadaea flava TaxID=1742688 RepID=A0ABV8M0K9_9ACTN|nr:hypothetical protein [Hamadaea flava]MCP2328414.1 hypothetical protein [Hamadaea flava]